MEELKFNRLADIIDAIGIILGIMCFKLMTSPDRVIVTIMAVALFLDMVLVETIGWSAIDWSSVVEEEEE